MRGFVMLGLLALALVTLGAHHEHRAAPASGPRARMLLDGDWEIEAGGSRWIGRVPEVNDLARQRDTATYRTAVTVPADWEGRGRVVLRFDRVLFRSRVSWNGVAVGEHVGNRSGFEIDVTSAVRWGAPNTLQVEAESVSGTPDLLRFYVTDPQHVRDAAVTGDVWLSLRPTLEDASERVVTSVRERKLTVTTRVDNHEQRAQRVTLRAAVRRNGETVLTLPPRVVDVAAGGSAESATTAGWPDARLWGPAGYGSPTLYTLRTEVVGDDGRVVDCRLTRFGFRELALQGTQLLLNGQPLFIAGHRTMGPELERHALALDMTQWQGMGFNAVESHEEARLPGYYDLADELGMLVVSGNFCQGMGGGAPAAGPPPALPPAPLEALGSALLTWVTEERNHPSIVLWNPCGADPQMREVVAAAVARADDTRPLPYRDYMPLPGFLQGQPGAGGPPKPRGAWFIFETAGRGGIDVLAPFLAGARDSGAFGVVINELPAAARTEAMLPWPSTSGPDPRPAAYAPRADHDVKMATTIRQALRMPPAEARTLPPEVVVTTGRPGALVAIAAVEGADMETTVEAADREGRAWFTVPEAGRYRVWLPASPEVAAERTLTRRDTAALRTLQTYDVVDLP